MYMTRNEARDYIKGKMPDYLQSTGRPLNKPFRCPNPSHDDKHPSAHYDPKSREKVICFSQCGKSYDIFDLIGFDYRLNDFNDQFKQACEIYGVEIDHDYTFSDKRTSIPTGIKKEPEPKAEKEPDAAKVKETADYIARCRANLDKCDYLQTRGISKETAEKMKIGYDLHFKTKLQGGDQSFTEWRALIMQTSETSYTARNMASVGEIEGLYTDAAKRERYRNRGAVLPFNLDALNSKDKPIFIVEGEIDALSVIEAGGNAVGLGGTSQINAFLNGIEKTKKGIIRQPLIIAMDNDKAGMAAAEKLTEGLSKLEESKGIKSYRYNIANDCKDANEALLKDRDGFIERVRSLKDAAAIEQAIKRDAERELEAAHRKEAINGKIDSFINDCIKTGDFNECYSTGIKGLDYLLDGGLYSGLYFIGALSGLGKTTFVLNIADFIAKSGHDILYFSLEMGTNELIAKSVSRHTMLRSIDKIGEKKKIKDGIKYAKTTREIMTANRGKLDQEQKDIIIKSLNDYYSYAADHIYVYEGVGDIGVYSTAKKDKVTGKETITKGIRERVADHVRIAKTSGGRMDEKPLVVIDYLQILAPYDSRATDKQNTDKSVVELKRMSRDYNIPVICISAFNRENYNEPVSMASFRESSAIEYGADCLIGLQFEGMDYEPDDLGTNGKKNRAARLMELKLQQEEKAKTREYQDIELKVLKNRNGIRGSVSLDFMPAFNYYRQKPR